MEKINSTSTIEISVVLKLTEAEARALQAMTVYGHKPFLEGFYEKLGKSYMKPYESGVISLFDTIKKEMPKHLRKIDDVRNIMNK